MAGGWLLEGVIANGASAIIGTSWRRLTGREIKIVSPRENEAAQHERRENDGEYAYRVRGRLKSKSPQDEIWVLVEDESNDYVSGEWSALIWGLRKPKAKIVAVVAGPTE